MPASEHSLTAKIHQMLPTPTTEHSSGGYNPAWGHGMTLLDAAKVIVGAPAGPATLLPTPAVNDMGRGKTVEDWDAWTDKMRAAHGNGNGHGKSLEIEAARIGAITAPPSPDGNTSLDDPHPHLLSLDVQGIPA
jgi:DNA (cytosine-5)-methyltransferase 1